jgi:hypothetical protein
MIIFIRPVDDQSFEHYYMKKCLLFLLLFICFCSAIYCQIITGTVLEKNTNSPIQHALVYFNGTSAGTYTDQKGFFELDISKNSSMPLTISALGYYSITLNDFPKNNPLLVYLPLKVFELNEVNISGKADRNLRKQNLRLFKEIFLGKTDNASNCEIINENDIIIFHENDTLKAYSLKPILVNNKALGYKISYYLDKFEFIEKNQTFYFAGNIIFDEDMPINNRRKEVIATRRVHSYLGSRMHFFRVLWENNLNSTGFSVSTLTNVKLNYNDIVTQKFNPLSMDTLKYLKYAGGFGISYFSHFPDSFIEFNKDSIYFDRNGYFDGLGITWEGRMAEQRVSDMLPYEFLRF